VGPEGREEMELTLRQRNGTVVRGKGKRAEIPLGGFPPKLGELPCSRGGGKQEKVSK